MRISKVQLFLDQQTARVGIVSDSRMNAHCNCPSSQRLAQQLNRPSHSRSHCLVDARCHQETPDNRSLWGQFVSVLVMKVPNLDRTEATNGQIALGIESSMCHIR